MLSSVSLHRQTFRKSERLCSRKVIENLVSKGKNIYVHPLRLMWLTIPKNENAQTQVAFSVPKRIFKDANERNRIKRHLREAYRKNKSYLIAFLSKYELNLVLLFVYTGKEIAPYAETEKTIISIIKLLAEDIQKINR